MYPSLAQQPVPFLCNAPQGHVCQFQINTASGPINFALPSGQRTEIPGVRPGADSYCVCDPGPVTPDCKAPQLDHWCMGSWLAVDPGLNSQNDVPNDRFAGSRDLSADKGGATGGTTEQASHGDGGLFRRSVFVAPSAARRVADGFYRPRFRAREKTSRRFGARHPWGLLMFKIIVAASLALTLTTGFASAQMGGPGMQLCKADAERLCPGIAPGGGRIIKCMKAHMDEVSIGCGKALKKLKG